MVQTGNKLAGTWLTLLSPLENAAFLMGTGDCIAQLVVEEKTAQQYSLVRTAKFASFGLVSVSENLS